MYEEIPTSLLVIVDSNFINLCKDAKAYIERLKLVTQNRFGNKPINLYTVSGRYGINHIDETVISIEVNDKNKTVFTQTLENASLMFDELIVVSVVTGDSYIDGAKEIVSTLNKSCTHYRYERK